MNKIEYHKEVCDAPLCKLGNNGSAIWYIGESICNFKSKTPRFVNIQIYLNSNKDKLSVKELETTYTVASLNLL